MMQSLGHACIFCTSNSKGQTSCLASYVVVGNSLSLGQQHIGFQPSLRWNAECSNGFLAGAEDDGGAETSEFSGDEP